MPMHFRRTNTLFVVLLSAAAIAAAAIFFINYGKGNDRNQDELSGIEDLPEQRQEERLSKYGKTDLGSSLDSRVDKSSAVEAAMHDLANDYVPFASAPSATIAQQIIDEARANSIEYAKDWEFKLANYCAASEQPEGDTQSWDPISKKPWLLKRMQEFCKGYPVPDTSDINSIENLMSLKEREYERELLQDLSSEDIDKQSDFITDAVANAQFPEQIDAVSTLLSDFSRTEQFSPWDPLRDNHFEVGYFEAQQFALQYFKCIRFRSCGQNSIWFTEMCLYFEPCTETWTFEDILINSVTPVQHEMGMRIVGVLFAQLQGEQQ